MKCFEKARKAVTACVVLTLGAAFSYGISDGLVLARLAAPRFSLTADGGAFTISGHVYATCAGTTTALLYPGVTRCLVVSVTDPFPVALTGTITTTVTSFAPTTTASGPNPCTVTTATPVTFTRTFSATPGTHVVFDHEFELETSGRNQDACIGGTFHFAFTGTAAAAYPASCETVSVGPDTVTAETGMLGHLDVSGGTVSLGLTAENNGNLTVAPTGVLGSTGATITGNTVTGTVNTCNGAH